mgnify:FL=1
MSGLFCRAAIMRADSPPHTCATMPAHAIQWPNRHDMTRHDRTRQVIWGELYRCDAKWCQVLWEEVHTHLIFYIPRICFLYVYKCKRKEHRHYANAPTSKKSGKKVNKCDVMPSGGMMRNDVSKRWVRSPVHSHQPLHRASEDMIFPSHFCSWPPTSVAWSLHSMCPNIKISHSNNDLRMTNITNDNNINNNNNNNYYYYSLHTSWTLFNTYYTWYFTV